MAFFQFIVSLVVICCLSNYNAFVRKQSYRTKFSALSAIDFEKDISNILPANVKRNMRAALSKAYGKPLEVLSVRILFHRQFFSLFSLICNYVRSPLRHLEKARFWYKYIPLVFATLMYMLLMVIGTSSLLYLSSLATRALVLLSQ